MRDLLKDLWEESENKKDTYKIWKKIGRRVVENCLFFIWKYF